MFTSRLERKGLAAIRTGCALAVDLKQRLDETASLLIHMGGQGLLGLILTNTEIAQFRISISGNRPARKSQDYRVDYVLCCLTGIVKENERRWVEIQNCGAANDK